MALKCAEMATGELASGIAAGDVALALSSGGSKFSTLAAGDCMYLRLCDKALTKWEIVLCEGHTVGSNNFTSLTRNVRSSTGAAQAWDAGDLVGQVFPGLAVEGLQDDIAEKVNLITSNTSFYVYSTGNDTTGDGSSGNPWKTLNKAFSYLADFYIASDVLVTIYLDAAVNDMGTTQTLSHPCGNRIQIFGQKQAIAITSIQSSSGSAGAYSIIINVDSVSGVSVGHFLHVNYASGGTNPERMCGLFEVTNVDAVNTRLTVLSSNRVGVPSGAVAATTAQARIIKTVLQFGTGHGISLDRGSNLYGLGALVLDGNGSGMYGLQMGNEAGGDRGGMLRTLDYVGVWDWGEGVLITGGAYFYARFLAVSKCTDGLYAGRCASIDGYGAVVSGCSTYGVVAQANGFITMQTGFIVGNANGVSASQGGHILTSAAYLAGFNTTDASPTVNTIGNHNAYIYSA